ncbi:MAG TPA: hypothetical protein PK329_09215 [Myxococcota bacterium]|jgi:hypothetical protein|nr:hypothetical protein [Oligoflexales bacterium]HOE83124.1 hypothetical protein [Myxococcota bacterium]HON25589.1 hypothetical protein [Myxococcota bacterium]HOS62586.1 hypothetical protein [Myxococcota bacterium]HPC92340.1 hypothetical protein [Myxococcota bacterium]
MSINFIAVVVGLFFCGLITGLIASSRGRGFISWFFLGVLFGIVGPIIALIAGRPANTEHQGGRVEPVVLAGQNYGVGSYGGQPVIAQVPFIPVPYRRRGKVGVENVFNGIGSLIVGPFFIAGGSLFFCHTWLHAPETDYLSWFLTILVKEFWGTIIMIVGPVILGLIFIIYGISALSAKRWNWFCPMCHYHLALNDGQEPSQKKCPRCDTNFYKPYEHEKGQ